MAGGRLRSASTREGGSAPVTPGQRRRGAVRQAQAKFIVSTALLEELGERLVSKPEVALAELIKNAYDADAQICTIDLRGDAILVSDDGHGMTEDQFLSNWMVVSSPAKGRQRFSRRYRRAMAGSKGVGRFSARFLGNAVELASTAEDKRGGRRTRLAAQFNWDSITRADSIEAVTIDYTVEEVDSAVPLGTTLRVTQLRREAQLISASVIKTEILRLTNPITGLEPPPFVGNTANVASVAEDPGFTVVFAGDAEHEGDEVAPSLQKQILDAYLGRVRLQVDAGGKLSYEVFWRGESAPIQAGAFSISKLSSPYVADKLRPRRNQSQDERGLTAEVAAIQQLPLATSLHSPLFVDLRFFPKRKGTFSALGVNGTRAQKWIRDHAGFALVDNHFAMKSYGPTSDWLGVDASKARNERDWQSVFTPVLFPMSPQDKADPARNPMLALPRGSQLIGRVHIATSKRPTAGQDDSDEWLQPNMDRLLWHICRFAAELIAHFDRTRRLEEARKENEAAEQAAKSDLMRAIDEIKESEDIKPEFRRRIVQQLRAVQSRHAQSEAHEAEVRVSLELMSMMGVLAGFMTHEFEKAVRALRDAASMLRRAASKGAEADAVARRIEQIEVALAHYMDYMRLFIGKARSPRPQEFKAHSQVSLVVDTLSGIAQAHHVKIDVDIDRGLPGPAMPVAAYHGIVVNLVSNALKALVPKASREQRRIRLYASNDATRHVLVCADNGIGIPEYLRSRIWDPLFTTTGSDDDDNPLGSGLGLGLSVVRQVVKHMRGSIELMEAPPGFVTAFRVTLPLH